MIDPRSAAAAACLVLALLAGCGGEPEEAHGREEHGEHGDEHGEHGDEHGGTVELSPEAYEAAEISVAPAVRRRLGPTVEVTGNLRYDERRMAVTTARVGGRITRVVADYGAAVAAGDVLAWIDSPELGAAQAEYRRALSLAGMREAEHRRAELLVAGRAISRGELLRREAEWRGAQADLERAEHTLHLLGLGDAEIEALARPDSRPSAVYPVRAPIRGKVTERDAIPGQVASPEDRLFVVADLGTLWLLLQVFEKDLPSVTPGAAVSLSCESHPEDRFEGAIDFVGEVLDPHRRTLAARAVIDNAAGKLKPGMFVYARIEGGAGEETLAVPAAAVTRIEGRDLVFVATGERSFAARPVEVGLSGGSWVAVRSGLAEGERVAVTGAFSLKSELLKGGLEGHHH